MKAAVAIQALVMGAGIAMVATATEVACVTVAAAMAAVFVTEAHPAAEATPVASRLRALRAMKTASGAVPIGVMEQGSVIPATGAARIAALAQAMIDVDAAAHAADGE